MLPAKGDQRLDGQPLMPAAHAPAHLCQVLDGVTARQMLTIKKLQNAQRKDGGIARRIRLHEQAACGEVSGHACAADMQLHCTNCTGPKATPDVNCASSAKALRMSLRRGDAPASLHHSARELSALAEPHQVEAALQCFQRLQVCAHKRNLVICVAIEAAEEVRERIAAARVDALDGDTCSTVHAH